MGGDGGSIPGRTDLVRTRKNPEKISRETELLVKWKHCAMSQAPLKSPIVACQLGRMFNKETLLEYLLDKSRCDGFEYIHSLKDTKKLNLTNNPAYDPDKDMKAGAGQDPNGIAPYICPVTGLEMNGRYKFCYIINCGCVFAERAVNELKDNLCFSCGKPFSADDVIAINGSEDEVALLKVKMGERRAKAKQARKTKATAVGDGESVINADVGEEPGGKKCKLSADDLNPDAVSSKAAKVDTTGKGKLNKGTGSKHASSKVGSKLETSKHGSAKEKKTTIQSDPRSTEAFKSLFNTHATALKQPKAHWVTYNPQYN